MKTPYLFERHLAASTLMRNLKSTHTGTWVYNTWPVAACTTDAWTRLVILPFYHQKRYPADYYTPEATITEL